MRLLDEITDSVDVDLGKLWDMVRDREALHAVVHGLITHHPPQVLRLALLLCVRKQKQ